MGIISRSSVADKLVEVASPNAMVAPRIGPQIRNGSVANRAANGLRVAPAESRGLVGAQLVVEVSLGRTNQSVEQ